MFSRFNHILGHQTSLNKPKEIEIISSTFYKSNNMKLETTYKEITEIVTNIWRFNSMVLNNFFGCSRSSHGSKKKSKERKKKKKP